jgi:hypothetical protein
MRQYIFLTLAFISVNAIADICPEKGEPIVTTPYKSSQACPAATIIIEGELNPKKYESCLNLVPSASEQVFYQAKNKKPLPLPTVNSLLPSDKDFNSRLWVVGSTLDGKLDVKCNGKNVVSIGFWGGGNCRGCERTVNYTFGNNGQFKSAKFKYALRKTKE